MGTNLLKLDDKNEILTALTENKLAETCAWLCSSRALSNILEAQKCWGNYKCWGNAKRQNVSTFPGHILLGGRVQLQLLYQPARPDPLQ